MNYTTVPYVYPYEYYRALLTCIVHLSFAGQVSISPVTTHGRYFDS